MKIVDANIVLRYLLADVPTLFTRSEQILEKEGVYLPFQVLAEVVYVLDKVYAVSRPEISVALTDLLKYPNVSTYNVEVVIFGLKTFSNSSLDIVDSLRATFHELRQSKGQNLLGISTHVGVNSFGSRLDTI